MVVTTFQSVPCAIVLSLTGWKTGALSGRPPQESHSLILISINSETEDMNSEYTIYIPFGIRTILITVSCIYRYIFAETNLALNGD